MEARGQVSAWTDYVICEIVFRVVALCRSASMGCSGRRDGPVRHKHIFTWHTGCTRTMHRDGHA